MILPQQQLTPDAMNLRFIGALFMFICDGQRFRHSNEPVVETIRLPARIGQRSMVRGPPQFDSARTNSGETFLYLCNPFFTLPLRGHRPAAHQSRSTQESGEPALDRDCQYALRSLLSCACLPAIFTDKASEHLGKSQTKRMR